MKLRYREDWRTLLVLALLVAGFASLWAWGFPADGPINWTVVLILTPILCFMGIQDAVIAHNHNHVSIFLTRWANLAVGVVISFFYGYPSIGWIPTHNMNHHRFNNKPGDYSITTRPFRKVGLLAVLAYSTVTSLTQTRLIVPFLKKCRTQNPFIFWRGVLEYVAFYGGMAVLFVIDWRPALCLLIVQQVALFVIQHFNYIQHIGTDSYSKRNHSRNFTGRMMNALLFNNGYHTVHHDKPGAHWSRTPALHRAIESEIDPRLKCPSFWGFWLRTFVFRGLGGKRPEAETIPADRTPLTIYATNEERDILEAQYEAAIKAMDAARVRGPALVPA